MKDKNFKTLKEIQLEYLEYILRVTHNNKAKTSKILNISIKTVYSQVQKLYEYSPEYKEYDRLSLIELRRSIAQQDRFKYLKKETKIISKSVYKLRQDNYSKLTDEEYSFPTNNERLNYADRMINADIPIRGEYQKSYKE